ncbi:hypothetical protein K7432_011060 [Basidiobolus ranarum]|uniref:site-specific DNA-methyltransferase (adenine-specific) n=1 Tax=Basidiobolus ranarum TaxID=34480 RepID=A0ABR2VVG5_9FUNG
MLLETLNINEPVLGSFEQPKIFSEADPPVNKAVKCLARTLLAVKIHVHSCLLDQSNTEIKSLQTQILKELNQLLYSASPDPMNFHALTSLSELNEILATEDEEDTHHFVVDFYCLMVAFSTVCQLFFDRLLHELIGEVQVAYLSIKHEQSSLCSFQDLFHDADNHMLLGSFNSYLWHYHFLGITANQDFIQLLGNLIKKERISFTSLDYVETIYSTFYMSHFLNASAQQHQKDRGQFFTPRSVVKFMWDRVLKSEKGESMDLVKLISENKGEPLTLPATLDPCMGIGGFLCEYINKVTKLASLNPTIWSSSSRIEEIMSACIESIWGIEIDLFTSTIGKLNIMIHLVPLYKRWLELQMINNSQKHSFKLPRLKLFCNDTLKLYLPDEGSDPWAKHHLSSLRDPCGVRFHYILTNPPYMIRKTGIVSEPDPVLYDTSVLCGKGTQAYSYFIWIALQKLSNAGILCLITASQWMTLEFAEKLRAWMWTNCWLHEFYQFEPYKVWRKVQTDSLIFIVRRRSEDMMNRNPNDQIVFLRYMDRKASLEETLSVYEAFVTDPNRDNKNTLMEFKLSPQEQELNGRSFSFLMPNSPTSTSIRALVKDLAGICDASGKSSQWSNDCPLIWHRGPNTNPVYALVVRTEWGRMKFGEDICQQWLRPVFYWNGMANGQKEVKEYRFWEDKDPYRLSKKEGSPAESYTAVMPRTDYSLIMVDKAVSTKIIADSHLNSSPFYHYLKEAREKLQPTFEDREIAYCGTQKCGMNIPIKIITPINYGYFSKNQPRQRFFVDKNSVCVTNQCIYFTVKPHLNIDYSYFLGLLNSSTIQFLMAEHCKYDQQGRMRLFRENMAKVPYKPPTHNFISWVLRLVDNISALKRLIFQILHVLSIAPDSWLEYMRQGKFQLKPAEREVLNARVSQFLLVSRATADEQELQNRAVRSIEDALYMLTALQYGLDQMFYLLYEIRAELQVELESELKLKINPTIIQEYPRYDRYQSEILELTPDHAPAQDMDDFSKESDSPVDSIPQPNDNITSLVLPESSDNVKLPVLYFPSLNPYITLPPFRELFHMHIDSDICSSYTSTTQPVSNKVSSMMQKTPTETEVSPLVDTSDIEVMFPPWLSELVEQSTTVLNTTEHFYEFLSNSNGPSV